MAARGKSERSRKERQRSEKPLVLIVCEGETEERYFLDVKNRFRARWIEVCKPHCNDPRGLVREARKRARKLSSHGLKVEPWVVFDAESAMKQGERGYEDAISEAGRGGIEVANSSPCFEYWILLHYAPGIVVAEPSEAERELRRKGRVPDFEKPALPYGSLWEAYMGGSPSKAARNRRSALEDYGEDPRLGRPVTYVDVLVDRLVEIDGM